VEPDGKARSLARFVLSRQGYRVIETDCSSTVLALWESQSTNVDLLLTDVALPEGLSGNALAEQLRQTKPELKVVYTSGGTEEEVPMVDEAIIPKPYTPDKLLQAIRNCLVQPERVLSGCAV
jgi:CheY-like chemotaxis protein